MPMGDCALNAKLLTRSATSLSSSSAAKASTQPTSKSRAAMTFSSTTITRESVHPKADIAVVQAGTKTTAIRRLMELRPDLLLRYQAVLFLDDDVEIGAEGIEALFRAMAAEKLDLAQPALTADSATAYPFLKRPSAGAGVMRVSSVEIMAPALTRRALECANWVFAESVSGWGSDLLLGPAVRAACRTDERRGHRLGRRPARGAGRLRRQRLLRVSAPLRRRSRTRGQQDRGRLRRRTLSPAARAGRSRRNLPSAARPRNGLIIRTLSVKQSADIPAQGLADRALGRASSA